MLAWLPAARMPFGLIRSLNKHTYVLQCNRTAELLMVWRGSTEPPCLLALLADRCIIATPSHPPSRAPALPHCLLQEYTANSSTMQYLQGHDVDAVWDTFHACGAERLQPAGSDGWGVADEAAEQGWRALDEEDEEERQKEEQQEGGEKPGGEREEGQGGGSEDEQEEAVRRLGQTERGMGARAV